MAGKQKFYVVWSGKEPGVYLDWESCQAQVVGVNGSQYKSFKTRAEADEAFQRPASDYIPVTERKGATSDAATSSASSRGKGQRMPKARKGEVQNPPDYRHDTVLPLPMEVTAEALAVDAACSGNPGPMEYRGVYLRTGEEVFHYGPVHGTNNIGEFLAIVHGLALLEQRGLKMTIYSDSRNALLWVKQKKCKTTLPRTGKTETLFGLIERAEQWLRTHRVTVPLLKWETSRWGEVPADFGRK